jgi:hypothetical protein
MPSLLEEQVQALPEMPAPPTHSKDVIEALGG